MLPPVSLPMAKPTKPAAVAAPGPALDPDEPSSSSHGFIVWPPNQMSFSASAPRLSLATSTAPASCKTLAPRRHPSRERGCGKARRRRWSGCRRCRADPCRPRECRAAGRDIFRRRFPRRPVLACSSARSRVKRDHAAQLGIELLQPRPDRSA